MDMNYGDKFTNEQLSQITAAIAAANVHSCTAFDDSQIKSLRAMSDMLDKAGQENLRSLLEFGGNLRRAKQAGQVAFVVALVGAVIGVIWLGILAKIRGEL